MKSAFFSIALAVSVSILTLAPGGLRADGKTDGSKSFQKWEYRVLRIRDNRKAGGRDSELRARISASQDTLNTLGADGWELVAVRNDGTSEPVFYCKRAKR